jgi:hypothetical protein
VITYAPVGLRPAGEKAPFAKSQFQKPVEETAMGTKMAPSYANIFMGKLEKLIIQSAPHKPLSWLRKQSISRLYRK